MKKTNKNEKGITLIALIITIIVLLILAGVSITLVLGDNGILNKATNAKVKTTIEDVKETAEMIKGEYEVDHEGRLPSSRFIIEKLILDGKIESSQVEDYGDENGVGIIVVEGERLEIKGSSLDENGIARITASSAYNLPDTTVYLLKNSKELVRQTIPGQTNGYTKYDDSLDVVIAENVIDTDLASWYLTDDNCIYDFGGNRLLSNIKEYNKEKGYAITIDDDWVRLDGSETIENVKELGNKYYITNDNKVYYNNNYITDNVKNAWEFGFSGFFILTNDNKLYSWDGTNLILLHEDVKKYETLLYLTNSNELYSIGNNYTTSSLLDTDVIDVNVDHFYIKSDNSLYSQKVKKGENAKEERYNTYIDYDNNLHSIYNGDTIIMNNVKEYIDWYFVLDNNNDLYVVNYNGDNPTSVSLVVSGYKDTDYNTCYWAEGENDFAITIGSQLNGPNNWTSLGKAVDYNECLILTSDNKCYDYKGNLVAENVKSIGNRYYVTTDGDLYYYVSYFDGVSDS